jgi:hypothetical protein
MTKTKKVILWGQDELLTKAMEILLGAEQAERWEVIRVSARQCACALVEQVQKIQPDLVILYQSKRRDASDPLVALLEEHPELRMIADQPHLRLITVSLENNVMQVYSKQSITVRKVSDLLSVIDDRNFSENPIAKEDQGQKTLLRSSRLPATVAGRKSS